MNRIFNDAYLAPELRELNVCCEVGFAASMTIDDVTSADGVWDE